MSRFKYQLSIKERAFLKANTGKSLKELGLLKADLKTLIQNVSESSVEVQKPLNQAKKGFNRSVSVLTKVKDGSKQLKIEVD